MRKQQKIWHIEHATSSSLPSLSAEEPSSAVLYFKKFISNKNTHKQKLVDIGSGKGRNAVYFAKQGLIVYCLEYIERAIEATKQIALKENLSDSVKTFKTNIDEKWPFQNNYFDYALDCFSSIDIETKKGRELCRDEMLRTLKPGGIGFIAVVSIEDEWEKLLLKTSKGNEPNSVIWPNGKFQKDYDEDEIRKFYNSFNIIEVKKIKKKAHKLNRDYQAVNLIICIEKPSA